MLYREYLWGFFFLFASVFILFISTWKLLVFLERYAIIEVFKIWEYFFYYLEVIVILVSIYSMIRSFQYATRDLTFKKTVRLYVKIIVLIAILYSIYNIFLTIEVLERW